MHFSIEYCKANEVNGSIFAQEKRTKLQVISLAKVKMKQDSSEILMVNHSVC